MEMKFSGKKLKHLRNAKGLTQQQVADEIDAALSQVNQWETGRHVPKAHRVDQLAALFKVDREALFAADPAAGGATRVVSLEYDAYKICRVFLDGVEKWCCGDFIEPGLPRTSFDLPALMADYAVGIFIDGLKAQQEPEARSVDG